jgi:hypothetical protein
MYQSMYQSVNFFSEEWEQQPALMPSSRVPRVVRSFLTHVFLSLAVPGAGMLPSSTYNIIMFLLSSV